MQLMIETLRATPIARRRMELVERKGLGHPDTICDALVEAVSIGLNRLYLERTGAILHYNVDKALLVAGRCEKEFGRGTLQRSIELIIGDRATDHFQCHTSAEDADSGQVGRGNRVNGLIAFARPTAGEAAAGKNPVAHVGKVYNVLSTRLAQLIHARCPDLEEVYVHLATRIGAAVDQPWVGVQIVSTDGTSADDIRPMVRDVVEAELGRMPDFCAELIRGAYSVC